MRAEHHAGMDYPAYFAAAVRAVAPDIVIPAPDLIASGSDQIRSGRDVWDWIVASDPVLASAVAGLTPEQRTLVQRVLDGMLHEHSIG